MPLNTFGLVLPRTFIIPYDLAEMSPKRTTSPYGVFAVLPWYTHTSGTAVYSALLSPLVNYLCQQGMPREHFGLVVSPRTLIIPYGLAELSQRKTIPYRDLSMAYIYIHTRLIPL